MQIWSRSTQPLVVKSLIKAVTPFAATPLQDRYGAWYVGWGSQFWPSGDVVTPPSAALTAAEAAAANNDAAYLAAINSSVTDVQAEMLLDVQIAAAMKAVAEIVWVPVTEPQAAALVCFAVGEGATVLKGSPMLAMLNAGRVDLAGRQMIRWSMLADPTTGVLAPDLTLLRRRGAEGLVFYAADPTTAWNGVSALDLTTLTAQKTAAETEAQTWTP